MPQNTLFSTNLRSPDQPKNNAKTFFPTLHPLSPFIFATARVKFVLLHNFSFNLHCYTQHEATPTQKSARMWRWVLSRLLAQKITKGIHSCKPASLNCLTEVLYMHYYYYDHDQNNLVFTFTVSISLKSQSEFWHNSLKLNPFFSDWVWWQP